MPPTNRLLTSSFQLTPGRVSARVNPAPAPEPCCCPACAGLECLDRTRFFAGQLLRETDLNNEQNYWLAKGRLHNRLLHGWGVVCGLRVTCGDCEGWVTVGSGYALDPCGNDVIVCGDQPFDVIGAIQACCAPPRQPANCVPLRYTPAPNCQDAVQTWCVTIEYDEQATRLTAPLKNPIPRNGSGRCGCECNDGNGKAAATPAASAPGAVECEATRIAEGFRLGVIPAPDPDPEEGAKPGTFKYEYEQCRAALRKLAVLNPFPLHGEAEDMTDAQAYQAVCNYLTSVRNNLFSSLLTKCQVAQALYGITVPPPNVQAAPMVGMVPAASSDYQLTLKATATKISRVIIATALDCLCLSLIPPCPPPPCDNRLVLACVTVQNGKILGVCHFGGRRQVITPNAIYYWMSAFGGDELLSRFIGHFQEICCGEGEELQRDFGATPYMETRSSVGVGGLNDPMMASRMAAEFVRSNLGADILNAVAPGSRAVDLRPFVGQPADTVTHWLRTNGVGQVTRTSVDADPAWAGHTVEAGARTAPSALPADQPVTVFTRGGTVVGFGATDPNAALHRQVGDLQEQLKALHAEVAVLRGRRPTKR